MIKRVVPYFKKEWIRYLEGYLESWDFWKEGILIELEDRVKNLVGRKYGIATNSTTNSIFMCLYIWSKMYPNKKEVILPNYGYPAAYKACNVLGLESIFLDCDILGMKPQDVSDNITMSTLAVVHIENNGVVGNVKEIGRAVKGGFSLMPELFYEDMLFIEDSAPSLVQDGAGIYGDVSVFSFSPTKPFCSGEGSVIVTDNKEIHDALKEFRYIGEYNNLNTSLNFAISSLLAAYLIPQFDFIDEIKESREWVHNEYKKHLNIFEEKSNRHGAIMYLSDKAENISKKLSQFDIEHRYKYYPNFIDTPNACKLREQVIDLPMHHELSSEQIKFICELVKRGDK